MAAAPASIRRARPLLGTFVEIAVAGDAPDAMEAAVDAAFDAVAMVHRLMSFHQADSDVSRLNRDAAAGPVRVHPWTHEVVAAALDLGRRSAGAFDIGVAPVLQRLGVLPDAPTGGARALALPPASDADAARETIRLLPDGEIFFADRAVKIDLGGIAKGFAVDRAVEALRRHGIAEGLVNAGGDLRGFGSPSHAVDIRDPREPSHPLCRVALRNAALASSAGLFDPVRSHRASASAVIDPATATPARSIIGATVCAGSCVIADALTKVVMNAGEAAAPLLEHYGADALFVSASGVVHMTANWKNEVRLAA